MSEIVIRYWLILDPDNRYGPKNIGVSGFSVPHARSLVKEAITRLGWIIISEENIDKSEIIENIDVRKLDQNHVIPNMGVVSRLGVWFPNQNYV